MCGALGLARRAALSPWREPWPEEGCPVTLVICQCQLFLKTPVSDLRIASSELILGGQKSGKTRRAESLAAKWLAGSARHSAVYIATAAAYDEEMSVRIARHREDRARRVPRMSTVEEGKDLAGAVRVHGDARTLVVVDCLTLWLTNLLMPVEVGPSVALGLTANDAAAFARDHLQSLITRSAGPVVLVSNEIGMGVVPLGREVRAFVDALGALNQTAADCCERVTLMAAGMPLRLKGTA